MRYLIAASLTAAFLGACDLTASRTRQQQPALLRIAPEDSIDFVAPDTVTLNANFSISVTTFGGGCDRKGPTDVLTLSDGTIEFRPFDITELDSNEPCGLEVQSFTHIGTVNLTEAGEKTITLFGRDWNGLFTSRAKIVVVK